MGDHGPECDVPQACHSPDDTTADDTNDGELDVHTIHDETVSAYGVVTELEVEAGGDIDDDCCQLVDIVATEVGVGVGDNREDAGAAEHSGCP
jgi:hypothetical protein